MKKETRAYLVRVSGDLPEDFFEQTQTEHYKQIFISQAEWEGNVYSLIGFENAFNNDEIDVENYWLRIY